MKLRRSDLSIALNEQSKPSSVGATYSAGRSLLRSYRNSSGDQTYRQIVPDGTSKIISSCRLPPASWRLLAACLLIALLIIPLAGCRRGGEPGTLIIAIEQPPHGFDPRFSTGFQASARVMQLLYDTLVVKDAHFEYAQALAEHWEESADHQTFTFKLRPGVRFHNGKPLTSADVKYTFDSIRAPETKSPIRGAVDKITRIDTPDPLTVVFYASEPFYSFWGNLPAIGIVPENAGADNIDAPVGSGPFRFASYHEGELVQLEANPDYWGGAPLIPRVRVKIVTDNSTRQAELMSGDVDLAFNAQFDPETARGLAGRRNLQVVFGDGANIGYLGCNTSSSSKLSDVRVRQAIAYAIDRDTIIHRLLRDQARKADGVMPPEHWAYNPDIAAYEYSPARAKEMLDQANFPDPDGDGPQVRLKLSIVTSTNQLSRNIAAILQDQLRRVGIDLELLSLESATMFDRLAKAQYDLYYLIGLGSNQSTDVFQFVYHSRYLDAAFSDAIANLRKATDAAQMRPLFEQLAAILNKREYCHAAEVDRLVEQATALDAATNASALKQIYLQIAGLLTDRGGQNRMRYCNPPVDEWIVAAERENDRAAKIKIYAKIQQAVADDLPQIYLWYPANVLIAHARVGNIQLDPSGSWYFIARLTLAADEGEKGGGGDGEKGRKGDAVNEMKERPPATTPERDSSSHSPSPPLPVSPSPLLPFSPSPLRSAFTGLSRSTVIIGFVSFLSDISGEMIYPVLPIFLTETLGAPATVVGLIEGVAIGAANAIGGVSGWISDRLGRHKAVAFAGYLMTALTRPIMVVAQAWPTVLGARFAERFGKGIRNAPRDALLAESTDLQYRGRAFGFERAMDSAGAVIGPLVALALVGFGARTIFLISAVPALLAALLLLAVRETRAQVGAGTGKLTLSLAGTTREYKRLILIAMVFGLGNSANAFLILRSDQLGLATGRTILAYTLFNIVSTLTAMPAGVASDRFGRRNLLIAGYTIYAISYLGFALATSAWMVWPLFALYGLFPALTDGVGKAMAVDTAGRAGRATAIGIYATVNGVTQIAASYLGGVLWDRVSSASTFYFGAALAGIAVVLLLLLLPSRVTDKSV